MGRRKGFKRGRAGRFVQLHHHVLNCEAWQAMKPGPRALYIELRKLFNGGNNGELFLSQRDAARALNVTKDTAGAYFKTLEAHGFIHCTEGGHLGPSGVGKASKWALDELPTSDGKSAKSRFRAWKRP